MPAEGVEIDIERIQVDAEMRGALRAVHNHEGADATGHGRDLSHWRDRAERVRHMRDRHDLRPRRDQRPQ